MKVSTIVRALAFVWRAKKIWRKPRQARTLIYDRAGSEVLLEYIDEADVEILDLRQESINLYVLFKCVLSFKLSMAHYAAEYTSLVRPSVAITFIDNNRNFYKLKNAHPAAVTVFLQNGWRGESGDIFWCPPTSHMRESYKVDYMLTFGSAVGEKYRQYVTGQVVPIGSVKNNLCKKEKGTNARSLVFISQFKLPRSTSDSVFYFEDDKPIVWEEFYSTDRKVLAFLAKYCARHKLQLDVCGMTNDPSGPEYEFLRAWIGNANWQFIPRGEVYASYKAIDRAEVVVFVDSTLGYESLARGKKAAAFSARGETLHSAATKFGWPAVLRDNGPFWTNYADEREFERVLDYLITVSESDWEKTRQQYVPELMEYDPGNTRFIALLQKLGVRLNGRCLLPAHS